MATHGEQESLLHHAARTGETETILGLLEQGAGPNELGHLGWTPLHTAALSGYIESVRLLVRSGANPATRNGHGHTPLKLAEERGHREVSYALRVAIVSSQYEVYSELSILDRMTEMFIELMESDELPPWKRPWREGELMRPRYPYGRRYSGINDPLALNECELRIVPQKW